MEGTFIYMTLADVREVYMIHLEALIRIRTVNKVNDVLNVEFCYPVPIAFLVRLNKLMIITYDL